MPFKVLSIPGIEIFVKFRANFYGIGMVTVRIIAEMPRLYVVHRLHNPGIRAMKTNEMMNRGAGEEVNWKWQSTFVRIDREAAGYEPFLIRQRTSIVHNLTVNY